MPKTRSRTASGSLPPTDGTEEKQVEKESSSSNIKTNNNRPRAIIVLPPGVSSLTSSAKKRAIMAATQAQANADAKAAAAAAALKESGMSDKENDNDNNNNNNSNSSNNGEFAVLCNKKVSHDEDYGDWIWGCCNGNDKSIEFECIECENKYNKHKYNVYFHYKCLKNQFNFTDNEINNLKTNDSGNFNCPYCVQYGKQQQEDKEQENDITDGVSGLNLLSERKKGKLKMKSKRRTKSKTKTKAKSGKNKAKLGKNKNNNNNNKVKTDKKNEAKHGKLEIDNDEEEEEEEDDDIDMMIVNNNKKNSSFEKVDSKDESGDEIVQNDNGSNNSNSNSNNNTTNNRVINNGNNSNNSNSNSGGSDTNDNNNNNNSNNNDIMDVYSLMDVLKDFSIEEFDDIEDEVFKGGKKNKLLEKDILLMKARIYECRKCEEMYVEQMRELAIGEVKNYIQFELEIDDDIDESLCSFLLDFCNKQQINWRDRFDTEGFLFYQSMTEMHNEKMKQAMLQRQSLHDPTSKKKTRKNKRGRGRHGGNGDSDSEWELDERHINGLSSDDDDDFDDYVVSEEDFSPPSDDSDGSDWAPGGGRNRRKKTTRRGNGTRTRRNNTTRKSKDILPDINLSEDDTDLNKDDWRLDAQLRKKRHAKRREQLGLKTGQNMDGSKRCGRLLLNDALNITSLKERIKAAKAKRKAAKLKKKLEKQQKEKENNNNNNGNNGNNDNDDANENSNSNDKDNNSNIPSNENSNDNSNHNGAKSKSKSKSKSPNNEENDNTKSKSKKKKGGKKGGKSKKKGKGKSKSKNKNKNKNKNKDDPPSSDSDSQSSDDSLDSDESLGIDFTGIDMDEVCKGWSSARRKAFENRKEKPNAYYYRFNDIGTDQRNGQWTHNEHIKFMKRALEFGVNLQWGIFSQKIRGRVGYQCSNYWRGLVGHGNVEDPNYFLDSRGKLNFRRKTPKDPRFEDLKRYGFKVLRDDSGVFGTQNELPKRHPKAPNEDWIKKQTDRANAAQQENEKKLKNKNKGKNKGGKSKGKSKAKSKSKSKSKNKNKNKDDDNEDNEDNEEEGNDDIDMNSNNNDNTNDENEENENSNSNDKDNVKTKGKSKSSSKSKSNSIGAGKNKKGGKKRKGGSRAKRSKNDILSEDEEDDRRDDNDNGNNNNDNDELKSPPRKRARRTKGKRGKKNKDEDFKIRTNSIASRVSGCPDDSNNPIPDFIDQMTGKPIVQPAIDKCGHVIGYKIWCKLLAAQATKNMCPFTKKRITRRQLVKLTKDNYDQYKDQIVNVNKK